MRSHRMIRTLLTAIMVLAVAASCARTEPGRATPTNPAPADTTTTPTPPGPPTGSPSTISPTSSPAGVVWPIQARTLAAIVGQLPDAAAVLTAIRTGQHATYDRLVLDFTKAYTTVDVRYVPVVRADPSDRVVTLAGKAYLQVTVHGAVAHWGAPMLAYHGPSTVTPGYATLKQVSISGDFEAVLSLGVGLDRVAGFQVMRLRAPDRLVIDVAKVPTWRMWPDDSLAAARDVQAAFTDGKLPWRGDPIAVAQLYARQVYGWSAATVTRVGTDSWYRLTPVGGSDSITVHLVWPFSSTTVNSVCEVDNTR
jgi:hypothetical protein